jgi:hypothetical protein
MLLKIRPHQELLRSMVKQLKIDLDKQHNPNPGTEAAYREAGESGIELWEDLCRIPVPAYENEHAVFISAKSSGSKIKHKITAIYRKKVGNKDPKLKVINPNDQDLNQHLNGNIRVVNPSSSFRSYP